MKLIPSQINESVDELKNVEKNIKMLSKAKTNSSFLFRGGQATTRRQIAEMIDVDRKSVGYWFVIYASDGLDAFLTRYYSAGRPLQLTPEQQDLLRSELSKLEDFSSYQQIIDYIEKPLMSK